jgi:hypothetical protein
VGFVNPHLARPQVADRGMLGRYAGQVGNKIPPVDQNDNQNPCCVGLGASGSMVSVCSPGGAAVNMLQELTIPGSTPLAKARNLMTSKHDSYK